MPCQVMSDLRKHLKAVDEAESLQAFCEDKAREIAAKQCGELQSTGRVEYLDMDLEDFACEILEIPIIGDEVTFIDKQCFDYLYQYNLKQVMANPADFMDEPDYSALEWN